MARNRLLTTLKDLALALLNATLLLLALCLFLAWQVAQTIDGTAARFAASLVDLGPLRTELQALTDEGAALRAELAALRDLPANVHANASGTLADPATAQRLAQLEARMAQANARIEGLAGRPEALLRETIDYGADRVSQSLADLMGCRAGDAL